jgi:perosamine synthetase
MENMKHFISKTIEFSRGIYGSDFIPLHRPVFEGNEKKYLIDCIDSNFVSSVGEKVTEFESKMADFTGAKYAIATVNGTAALHVAIEVSGVARGDEVITQAVTFIATCNAISYSGAHPVFIDVDLDTLGMSPEALTKFLKDNAEIKNGSAFNKGTGRKISGCIPMHTFGLPCRVKEILQICDQWGIVLIEDCAESLGSYANGRHTGTFGETGIFSFNGNKLMTTGGGGMLITGNEELAKLAKHKSTTSKVPHPFEFTHDEIGYNYRMPNLNAALGCAQIERLNEFLSIKANVAAEWQKFFDVQNVNYPTAIEGHQSNNWLNAIILDSKLKRDTFVLETNNSGVMTRPIWTLMSKLEMFKDCQCGNLENSLWLEDRVANIPSSVPDGALLK